MASHQNNQDLARRWAGRGRGPPARGDERIFRLLALLLPSCNFLAINFDSRTLVHTSSRPATASAARCRWRGLSVRPSLPLLV